MPDKIIDVTQGELATGRVLPPGMVRDLRAVAAVETSAVGGFAQALRQETGVLTKQRVENLTRQFFDDATAESVVRTILILRPESKEELLALVDRARQVSDERRQLLPDAEFAALKRNLDALGQDYPSLALMRKAQRLLRDTGNEIVDSIFICDLRPVFDEPQKRVEGFVALANLRVQYIRQNGDRDVFEIVLTEDEVLTLIQQAKKALKKMKVLKETVHELIQ